MAKQKNIDDFMKLKFRELNFEGEWEKSFGKPESNFRLLVSGKPKNGKTEFCIKLVKYLSRFTKVIYNSYEQGFSKSLQDALRRNKMMEVSGKVHFTDGESIDEMIKRLKKRNSPGAYVIDSLDYMNLTAGDFKRLIEACPNKIFIVICWGTSLGEPKKQAAKDICFMVDCIASVQNFVAHVWSRFGGCEPYIIWPERARVSQKSNSTGANEPEIRAEKPTINMQTVLEMAPQTA